MDLRSIALIISILFGLQLSVKANKQNTLSYLLSNAKKNGLNIAFSSTITDSVQISNSIIVKEFNIDTLQSFLKTIGFELKQINDIYVVTISKKTDTIIHQPIVKITPSQKVQLDSLPIITRVKLESPLVYAPPIIEVSSLNPITLFQYRYIEPSKTTSQNSISLNILRASVGIITISYNYVQSTHWNLSLSFSTRFWAGRGKSFNYLELTPSLRYFFKTNAKGLFLQTSIGASTFDIEGLSNGKFFYTNLPQQKHKGWFMRGGLSFGYRMPITVNIFMEPTIGYGYHYIKYRQPSLSTEHKWGGQDIGLNIGYVF